MNMKAGVFFALIFLLTAYLQPLNAQTDTAVTQIDQLSFTSNNFDITGQTGLMQHLDGIAPDNAATTATYTSDMLRAPIGFNAVVPEWTAVLPETTALELELRSGSSPNQLGAWQQNHANLDWTLPEEERTIGEMLFLPDGEIHQYVQYRVVFKRETTLVKPILNELRLVFINSGSGPPAAELAQKQAELAAGGPNQPVNQDEYPKPDVISRDVWCLEPECVYDPSELAYYPVSHLILHHTVTSEGADSAAIVRAIWKYHTFTRGWGDVGYNFLVGMDGLIYEGHMGGDDVVGIHARDANEGSMGLAVLGDFRYVFMSDPMYNSVVEMFAWKADQRDIDLFDASNSLPNVDYGLPHVMGHRDYSGETICPGDNAHNLIPDIRDEAAARIGLVSPHIYVDELSSAFTKSNDNWYEPIYNCGHNTHAWYTWSTTDPNLATNWGEWRPNIPYNGRYQIEAFVPYCNTGAPETSGAAYTIQHAQGSSTVVKDQNAEVGLWISLGEFDLNAGNGSVVRLVDLTTTDEDRGVWFDSLRLLPLEINPTAVNAAPANGVWLNNPQVNFEWSVTEADQVISTTLEVAAENDFNAIVAQETWATAVTSATLTIPSDKASYHWRIKLEDEDGNVSLSPPTSFGLDSTPPETAVTQLIQLPAINVYAVSWQGSDNLTGVAAYTIEYRSVNGDDISDWIPWLTNVNVLQANFTPPDAAMIYQFRSQGRDNVDNIEAPHTEPDISTEDALLFSHAIMLPAVLRP